jgi:hypothetical protein
MWVEEVCSKKILNLKPRKMATEMETAMAMVMVATAAVATVMVVMAGAWVNK